MGILAPLISSACPTPDAAHEYYRLVKLVKQRRTFPRSAKLHHPPSTRQPTNLKTTIKRKEWKDTHKKYPPSSTLKLSPVLNHPPSPNAAALASGLPQYPAITLSPRSHSSPGTPGGASEPSGRTVRACMPGMRMPVHRGGGAGMFSMPSKGRERAAIVCIIG